MDPDLKIGEVIIRVGDVDQAIAFYTGACRFKLVRTHDAGGGKVAELDAGGQRVTLVQGPAPGVHLALATEDARADHRRLRRRSIPTDGDKPLEVEGGTWVAFTDPWGNRLAFWQPPPAD